jgi:hypothetical protein
MRKFKLIREYPNSPKIGTIAEKKDEHSCYHLSDIFHQPLNSVCIENYPEFWEEVKEEFPKIISFRKTDASKYVINLTNRDNYNGWSLNGMLHAGECVDSGDFEIYQVATSETEVFTLGDKVKHPFTDGFDVISKFIICKDPKRDVVGAIDRPDLIGKLVANVGNCFGNCNIEVSKLEKASEVLFVTEDGVEIFKGDKFYYISIREPNQACCSGCAQEGSAMNTNCKYFSTVEAAKKYIDENKPIYSKKQIEEALNYGTYMFIDVELFKSRLGL